MARKLSKEGKDYRRLQALGFDFRSSQDEFSQQPDSGGTQGGIIGKQEYGIDNSADATSRSDEFEAAADHIPLPKADENKKPRRGYPAKKKS
jgi:hypothetical protein